jgi:hypothetical protein
MEGRTMGADGNDCASRIGKESDDQSPGSKLLMAGLTFLYMRMEDSYSLRNVILGRDY